MSSGIYIIIVLTLILLFPLAQAVLDKYFYFGATEKTNTAGGNEILSSGRIYSVIPYKIEPQSDGYRIISAKALNDSSVIIFCEDQTSEFFTEYPLKLMKVTKEGLVSVSVPSFSYNMLLSVENKFFSYFNYGDSTIFLSDGKDAYLFDVTSMLIRRYYEMPRGYAIYQVALSNNKDILALATSMGLIIYDIESENTRELISATASADGTILSPKYPVWSASDEYIYYTLYSGHVKINTGRTTLFPGGNQMFSALDNINTHPISDNMLFYCHSSLGLYKGETSFEYGLYNTETNGKRVLMKTSVAYYDAEVSPNGSLFAALSHNGKMIKISIIDIYTKNIIYSDLYDTVTEFSFSPDERGFIILGEKNGEMSITLLEIDWKD